MIILIFFLRRTTSIIHNCVYTLTRVRPIATLYLLFCRRTGTLIIPDRQRLRRIRSLSLPRPKVEKSDVDAARRSVWVQRTTAFPSRFHYRHVRAHQ